MTDKPKIEVGQRWVTRGGDVVCVLSTSAREPQTILVQDQSDVSHAISLRWPGGVFSPKHGAQPEDLISLAPQTVKREVALYRAVNTEGTLVSNAGEVFVGEVAIHSGPANYMRISEQQSVEFTLLPGEST